LIERESRQAVCVINLDAPDAVFSILELYAVWILSHFRVSEGGAIKDLTSPSFAIDKVHFLGTKAVLR